MGAISLFTGKIAVEVTSAAPDALFSALQKRGTVLEHISQKDDLTWSFTIDYKEYKHTCEILDKRNERYKIIKKVGLPWFILRLYKRPVLIVGIAVFLVFALYLPTRVMFVSVEGNQTISADVILDEAAKCGIGFGASRKAVRSEKMKNKLLLQLPQLKWAGINTAGCRAIITVKERSYEEMSDQKEGVVSIVADRDGIVQDLSVLKGSAQCRVGEVVHSGQVLISGYTDCGIATIGQRAEGEILARTTRKVQGIYLKPTPKRDTASGKQRIFGILLGKKLINLRKGSGNYSTECVKIYEQRYLKLPGGFCLPAAMVFVREEGAIPVCDSEDNSLLIDALISHYLAQQMVSGKVLQYERNIYSENGTVYLDGIYYCLESIGIEFEERELFEYEQRN